MSQLPVQLPPAEDAVVTRRAGLVALGTFSSRVLGAVRDAVIAASFSLTGTDAFFVAWTIPNTLRQVLGEGAVSAAFIPVFARVDEQQGRQAARRYYGRFSGTLLALLLAVSAIGVVTAPFWATLYAGGYRDEPSKFQTTVQLTALVFPYLVFAGMAALQAGALNALGRFLLASFSPALLNVCMIAAPFVFVPLAVQLGQPPIAALALAALAGGALQVLSQIPSLRAAGLRERPRLGLADRDVRDSLGRMVPLIAGSGVYQINILLSRLLASLLPAGSLSFLYYGQRLIEIPLGMLTLAVASAALPSLARLGQRGDHEQAKAVLRHSIKLALFVAIPASAALFALALPTVAVLFGRGEFGPFHVQQTAHALAFMAAGVWAVASVQGLTRMFYAYDDTRTPVLCSAVNLVFFLGLSLSFMRSLGHVAIALANSGAAVIQLALLAVLLRRRIGPLGGREVAKSVLRNVLASAVMAYVASEIAALGDWTRGGNDPRNLAVYALAAGFGLAVYIAASYVLGSPELQQIAGQLRRRVRST